MTYQPFQVDLTNCDKEPIHIPGRVQPHGFLLVCQMPELDIIQVSDNTVAHIGLQPQLLLSQNLKELLNSNIIELINDAWQADNLSTITPATTQFGAANLAYSLIAHRWQEFLILEFEPISLASNSLQSYHPLSHILQILQESDNLKTLSQTTAEQIKLLTGFDRVMVYRFEEDWHGQVIAEAKNDDLEPFLGLHFPASDIPAQARELYKINLIRSVVDVTTTPSNLLPLLTPSTDQPLDLTHSVLRAVSPIHIEYLQNMGVAATMSISIIHDGDLWGLLACHHYAPKFVDYNIRNVCGFISRIFAGYLPSMVTDEDIKYAEQLAAVGDTLLEQMGRSLDVVAGLTDYPITLINLNSASGAAIYFNDDLVLHEQTPTEEQIFDLIQWLADQANNNFYHTDKLSAVYAPAQAYVDTAAGLLALSISEFTNDWLLWFKPEKLQTVDWSGNPEKPVTVEEGGVNLSPRKSFEKWTQVVHGKSLPWQSAELNAALKLREHIKNIIIQYTGQMQTFNEQLKKLNRELESFSYSVSHDLRSPLRIIDSYSEILLEDYHDQLDEEGREILRTILENTNKMSNLIDDLLAYSRVGRAEKLYNQLDVTQIVQEAIETVMQGQQDRAIIFDVKNLPMVEGDRPLIRQLMINLLSNAVKYTRPVPQPRVEISGEQQAQEVVYLVKDNGIGFDMKYVDKIFNVFSRLHDETKFEGTGIGLALVKRIVQSHGGRVWVESQPGQGSTFYIAFPLRSGYV